jgi:hypothetical protein
VKIELESRSEEVVLQAYTQLAAIAQAFGTKNAIKKLGKSMGTRAGEQDVIRELRSALGPMVQKGLIHEKKS